MKLQDLVLEKSLGDEVYLYSRFINNGPRPQTLRACYSILDVKGSSYPQEKTSYDGAWYVARGRFRHQVVIEPGQTAMLLQCGFYRDNIQENRWAYGLMGYDDLAGSVGYIANDITAHWHLGIELRPVLKSSFMRKLFRPRPFAFHAGTAAPVLENPIRAEVIHVYNGKFNRGVYTVEQNSI